jgi:hypothetical protein
LVLQGLPTVAPQRMGNTAQTPGHDEFLSGTRGQGVQVFQEVDGAHCTQLSAYIAGASEQRASCDSGYPHGRPTPGLPRRSSSRPRTGDRVQVCSNCEPASARHEEYLCPLVSLQALHGLTSHSCLSRPCMRVACVAAGALWVGLLGESALSFREPPGESVWREDWATNEFEDYRGVHFHTLMPMCVATPFGIGRPSLSPPILRNFPTCDCVGAHSVRVSRCARA